MTDNTVIEGTAQSSELIWIDPNHLAAHPANIRTDLGLKDLAELSASIAARGVIEPLIVAPEDAGYRILAGHRRCAAAITVQLATVPCWIRGDLTDNADQVITMLVENTRRRDLSIAEEASGYAQLALAGSPPGRSPRRPGGKQARVKRALTIAKSPVATATVARYDLSLDEALAVAEFDTDPEAVKLLVVTATKEPQRWDHVLARLRADRNATTAFDAAVARMVDSGVRSSTRTTCPRRPDPSPTWSTATATSSKPTSTSYVPVTL